MGILPYIKNDPLLYKLITENPSFSNSKADFAGWFDLILGFPWERNS